MVEGVYAVRRRMSAEVPGLFPDSAYSVGVELRAEAAPPTWWSRAEGGEAVTPADGEETAGFSQ